MKSLTFGSQIRTSVLYFLVAGLECNSKHLNCCNWPVCNTFRFGSVMFQHQNLWESSQLVSHKILCAKTQSVLSYFTELLRWFIGRISVKWNWFWFSVQFHTVHWDRTNNCWNWNHESFSFWKPVPGKEKATIWRSVYLWQISISNYDQMRSFKRQEHLM